MRLCLAAGPVCTAKGWLSYGGQSCDHRTKQLCWQMPPPPWHRCSYTSSPVLSLVQLVLLGRTLE